MQRSTSVVLPIKMFAVHLVAYYFSKLQEDPTKKVINISQLMHQHEKTIIEQL